MEVQQPDAIYCLGDFVGFYVWAIEVINEVRHRGIPCIAGNYDQGIGLNGDDCGCAYKTEEEKQMGKISISFTNTIINEEERKYLRTLPAHIRLQFQGSSEKLNVLFVHGSPRKINEYLFEDRDEQSLLRIMKDADADIMCFGHTHKPYHRILSAGTDVVHNRHAINIGSVGKPKDANPKGCYVMLTINENSSTKVRDSIQVEFIRFEYDVQQAMDGILGSPLPHRYAEMLRTGN
jgi:predicted phosphodiesterase